MEKSNLLKSKSGATSRSKAPDFSLCPPELELEAIERFEYGLSRGYARNNWKIGKDDSEFILERLNHAKKHLNNIIDKTGSREDLQAVVCNLAMICWFVNNGNGAKEALPHLFERREK